MIDLPELVAMVASILVLTFILGFQLGRRNKEAWWMALAKLNQGIRTAQRRAFLIERAPTCPNGCEAPVRPLGPDAPVRAELVDHNVPARWCCPKCRLRFTQEFERRTHPW